MIPRLVARGIPNLLPMTSRSQGCRVSDIIHNLCIRLGLYGDKSELNMTRLQFGCAWEDAIKSRFYRDKPDSFIDVGELELDGVFGTPDLYQVIPRRIVHEFKLTWMSNRGQDILADKYWRYWAQVKAYCKMLGCNTGCLSIGYVNGDHTRPFEPAYESWECEFDRCDIEDNWRMLIDHGRNTGLLTI